MGETRRKLVISCHSGRIQPVLRTPPTKMSWIGMLTANSAAPIVLGEARPSSSSSSAIAGWPGGGEATWRTVESREA
jgi:hypothetical protein